MICCTPPLHSLPFFSFALFLSLFSLAEAKCYNYDGSLSKDVFKPCNGTAQASMCCQIGASSNNGDACGSGSEYGLCGVTGTQLYRESCTDPTWKSPACLKLCVNGAGASGNIAVTACQDGSFCCGQQNSSCCQAGNGMFIVKDQVATALPTLTVSISSAATPTSSSRSTPTSSSLNAGTSVVSIASTPTGSEASIGSTTAVAVKVPGSSGLSRGAKAGLGIGIPILVLALFGIGFYFFRRYWQRRHLKYKGDEQDTTKILPVVVADCSDFKEPSRPNTAHTRNTTLETTSTKAFFENEAPAVPGYFGPGPIFDHRMFSKDSFSEPWAQKGESKESFPMQTFAIEMDAGSADDRIFPINPHLVEMDAHEPRAVNDGVFEMPVFSMSRDGEDSDTESTLGIKELFQAHDKERELTPDPNQSPTSEAEDKISHTPLASPLDKESQGKETLSPAQQNAQARISDGDKMLDIRPQDPLDKESDGKEAITQSELQHAIVRRPKSRIISPLGSPSHSTSPSITPISPVVKQLPEIDRSRSRARTKSSSSISKSQFSTSPSPTRTPSMPLHGMISAPASIRERSVSRTRVPTSKRLTRGSEFSVATETSSMRRSKTHIGSMVTDTRVSVRPRKKSFGGKSPIEINEAELLRSLEYRPEGSGMGSGIGMGIESGPLSH